MSGSQAIANTLNCMPKPIIISHRGACGYLPEHTLESATLAFAMGTDYVEQDLVLSGDGHLIVTHDIYLETVTNVESQFPQRARADGRYYVLDFTLAELKTLSVHERTDTDGNPAYPNRYQGNADFKLATFDEQIELVDNLNRQFNRDVGIYPEIKSPAWHQKQGHDISRLAVKALEKSQLNHSKAKVFMQCFDFAENQRLRYELDLKTQLIQLLGENSWGESTSDYDALRTPSGLAEIAQVANGIGPWIPQLVDIKSGAATGLVERAHEAGLAVHPYTFRIEELDDGDPQQVLKLLFETIKIDGLFTDFTDVVAAYLAEAN